MEYSKKDYANIVKQKYETVISDYHISQQEILSEYSPFDISFDQNGKMLFNGELVRYFWDGFYIEGCGRAIHYEYANKDGKIDIHTTRTVIDNNDRSVDYFGELTGIVKYKEKEFSNIVDNEGNLTAHYETEIFDSIAVDENTAKIYKTETFDSININDNENTINTKDKLTAFLSEYGEQYYEAYSNNSIQIEEASAEGLNLQKGKTFAEIFSKYKNYGVEYKEEVNSRGNVYYNGKLVKHFADQKNNGTVFTYESKDGGEINVHTVYDTNGKLIGITVN